MANDAPEASSNGVEAAELAKAFQDLAKGERTATALEGQLSAIEAKIEEMLRQAEREQAGRQTNGGSGEGVGRPQHESNGDEQSKSTS